MTKRKGPEGPLEKELSYSTAEGEGWRCGLAVLPPRQVRQRFTSTLSKA